MVNRPDKLLRISLTVNACRLDHKRTSGSTFAGFDIHVEINDVQVPPRTIRVVAEVVEQVADDIAIKFRDQPGKCRLGAEPISPAITSPEFNPIRSCRSTLSRRRTSSASTRAMDWISTAAMQARTA